MDGMKLFAIYLVVMNVLGVAVMWSDKRRAGTAVADWRRYSLAACSGSARNLRQMYLFPPQD